MSRGTKDQLSIDKTVLKDCRNRKTNLAMAWIDYKKAYDMVSHYMDYGMLRHDRGS